MLNLDLLNPAQRKAVQSVNGPFLILAGAGSGKTRVLTYRIAYLIKDLGVAPWNILALTFTNKAASEMKQRLLDLGARVDDIWVGTFHSICSRILRINAGKIGFESSFTIYDSDDQTSLVRQCIKELNINDSAMKPNYVKSCISDAKNKFILPEHYIEFFGENPLAKKVQKVYARYQEALSVSNAMDFDDLILNVIHLFERDKEVLEYYKKHFKYIHVDEYQDTNMVQYRLIKLLINDESNICVVGDNDQSIYGWRGADIRNIIEFEKDFPGAEVIMLERNYRSTQNILNLANSVISHNRNRRDKNLWSNLGDGDKILCYIANNEKDEAQFVADTINAGIQDGAKFEDYAILYRTNAQSHNFEYILRRAGIKYDILGGLRFYDRKEIKDLIAYLKFVVNPYDEVSFRRCINEPKRSIGLVSIDKIVFHAAQFENNILKSIEYCISNKVLSAKASTSLRDFYHLMMESMNAEFSPSQVLENILEKTKFTESFRLQNDVQAIARLENIDELLSQMMNYEKDMRLKKEEYSLSTFLQDISLISDQDKLEEGEKATLLMTIHTAKGLEFKNVFLVGMEDGIFPSMLAMNEDGLEEERRLCYVAITRAKEKLYLCRANRRERFGKTEVNLPSRFFDEMDEYLLETKTYSHANFDNTVRTGDFIKAAPILNSKTVKKSDSTHRFKFGVDASEFLSKAPKKLVSNDEKSNIKIGDRVKHKFFGEGSVIAMGGESPDDIVIAFDTKGQKILSKSASPINKI